MNDRRPAGSCLPDEAGADSQPRQVAEGSKILDIERLRGIAILCVVFSHLALCSALMSKVGLAALRQPFWLGVELFFVISGFVVTRSFMAKMSFRRFYLRRVFRLWPVLLVFFAVTALVNCTPTPGKIGWADLLARMPSVLFGYYSLIMTRRPVVAYFGHLWSLSMEEQFYLVAPALLFILSKSCRQPARACRWAFLGIYLVLAVGVRFWWVYGTRTGLPLPNIPFLFQYLACHKFDFLALGVLLYFASTNLDALRCAGRGLQKALLYVCLCLPFYVVYRQGWCGGEFNNPKLFTFGYLLSGLSFLVVVALASLNRNLLSSNRMVDRILLYTGSRSYGIYVLHPSIACLILTLPGLFHSGRLAWPVLQAGLMVLFGVPLVELTYRLVEKPGIRLGNRLINRLSPSTDRPREAPAALDLEQAVAAPRKVA